MDAGFYRGTNIDQDSRYGDKEKKLLKQMKFESVLDTKVDLAKINLEVLKPWITCKLNDILGIEDDVVIEYVFTQLEEKKLNPKVMQINLTGFLNARRSREFMGELWNLFIEAQESPDGIPKSIVEKKMEELKSASVQGSRDDRGRHQGAEGISLVKATETDWKHRYQSLTGGRYGKTEPSFTSESIRRSTERDRDVGGERRRADSPPSRRRADYDRDHVRNRDRDRDDYRRRRRSRTRSPPVPPPRRFSEAIKKEESDPENVDNDDEHKKRKKKRKHRHHSSDEDGNKGSDDDEGRHSKKSKKHKKEKKRKRDREHDD